MKIKTSDVLFGVQMLGMSIFVIGQFERMTRTVQGVSPMWLLCAEVFILVNLSLAYRVWRQNRERSATQLLVTHASWAVGVSLLVVVLLTKWNEVDWGWYDTVTVCFVSLAVVVTLVVANKLKVGIAHPMIRGVLAAVLRGVPHLAMAYKVSLLGGQGIAAATIWSAHLTGCVRIAQLVSVVRQSKGWDTATRGMALGEFANEITWIVVTVCWWLA